MNRRTSNIIIMYRELFVALITSLLVCCIPTVCGSGCQNECECGFDWTNNDLPDNDVTLRYEVMAGLVGAFAPLVIGGLSLLTYKLCTRTSAMAAKAAASGMPVANPFASGPWRKDGRGSGRSFNNGPPAYDTPRGSTPISLYGETDSDFIAGGSASQTGGSTGGHSGTRPGTVNSRFTNIHRNVKSDLVNQWFKNVNSRKY